jgi:hypothetical protein
MAANRDTTKPSRRRRWVRRSLATAAGWLVLAGVYLAFVRPWHKHWGATADEIARSFPGDSLVQDPQEVTTRAIVIKAQPRHIWPWLAHVRSLKDVAGFLQDAPP